MILDIEQKLSINLEASRAPVDEMNILFGLDAGDG